MSGKPALGPGALLVGSSASRASRSADRRPLVVDGARSLVPLLARELREGGEASAVREGGSYEGAAALVWIGDPDEARLREASRRQVPIVGVNEGQSVPYVLDTRSRRRAPRRAAAGRARSRRCWRRRSATTPSASPARLPVLREAVVDELIRSSRARTRCSRAAIWIPGVDMPVLTLNQARLVLAIALAHGRPIDRSRLPDIAGVVGAGFGFRAFAHQVLKFVPVVGWAAKGAVAWGGTRAVGEAARRRFGGL